MKRYSFLNIPQHRNAISSLAIVLGLSVCSMQSAYSQDKNQLVLADQYFSGGEYLTAASLYGQYLNARGGTRGSFPLSSKCNTVGLAIKAASRPEVLLRQAESYRLANYWKEAMAIYESINKSSPNHRTESLYWMAVCQRNLSDFANAEKNIDLLLADASADEYRQLGEKEKQTLQFIKSQILRPDTVLFNVKKLEAGTSNGGGVYGLFMVGQNDIFFTGTKVDTSSAAGQNPNHNRIFHSFLNDGRTELVEPLVIEGLDATMNQGAVTMSPGGAHIYFTQWKKGTAAVKPALYFSSKTAGGWSKPALLHTVNINGYASQQPFCSADGKFLFFASDRVGGLGKMDIWYAPLQADGTTGAPVNAGALINTAGNEQSPYFQSSSGQLVFASDNKPGMGGFDLYVAPGNIDTWDVPVNMGFPVNSVRDDVYFFAPEGEALLANAFVSSDRDESCCLASYAITKQPKKKMISGYVQDCETKAPVQAASILLKDGQGTTTIKTGADGRYAFELKSSITDYQLLVQKDSYKDQTANLLIERSDVKGWLIDDLFNSTICLEKKPVLKVENVVSVYFDFDRSELKARGIAQLDSIYTHFMQDEKVTLQISGYTDGRGTEAYNKVLSDKRAKACASYLMAKGVAPERISFASFGACCPIEMELINGRDNPDGRALNRRALINIVKE